MNQYAGILTFVDNQEHEVEDSQRIIGMTDLCPTREGVETEAVTLAQTFMVEEYPYDWQMRLDSGEYSLHLDILQPGRCNAQNFLSTQWAHLEDDQIVFR